MGWRCDSSTLHTGPITLHPLPYWPGGDAAMMQQKWDGADLPRKLCYINGVYDDQVRSTRVDHKLDA
jgi:hypothetical protein